MRKLKVGDKVNMFDGSYVFGVQNGKYTETCNNFNGDREELTVIEINLDVLGSVPGRHCVDDEPCDILVAGNNGFWFVPSDQVGLCNNIIKRSKKMSNREAISRVEAAEKELALAKKALKKGLGEFGIKCHHGGILTIKIDYGDLVFDVGRERHRCTTNLEEAREIYKALGRLIGLI